jgi:hypothetical protein
MNSLFLESFLLPCSAARAVRVEILSTKPWSDLQQGETLHQRGWQHRQHFHLAVCCSTDLQARI